MITTPSMEEQLRKVLVQRINDIAEEESKAAFERIKARIITDASGLAPTIMSRMKWEFEEGELKIIFPVKRL